MSDGQHYMTGFGNHFATEARAGALPVGQNSPQLVPFGLYAEQWSGTAFTAPRSQNLRTWFYRQMPSAAHAPFRPYNGAKQWHNPPYSHATPPAPNRLRWSPPGMPEERIDFVDSLCNLVGNGDLAAQTGIALHLYATNASMDKKAFLNADAEMLLVPQDGDIEVVTECGIIDAAPLQIVIIPRGLKFQVNLKTPTARGYVCENFGAAFRLPDLGPIGANGLANPRDFEVPVAGFKTDQDDVTLVQKYLGAFWQTQLSHSPFDVVAWHGNLAPYRYGLRRFNTMNSVSFDHPDPSIFSVLTSPTNSPGVANCDFVIFPPRWMVAEHTFRPPWFHRNIMSEFMGLIEGTYDAKADGFLPGGASLHNCMSAHGPDATTYQKAITNELRPERYANTMAFMFETRLPMIPSPEAMASPLLQSDYDQCWAGFDPVLLPEAAHD